jgi:hypothetical protein
VEYVRGIKIRVLQLGFENGQLRQRENDESDGNFLKGYKNCFN